MRGQKLRSQKNRFLSIIFVDKVFKTLIANSNKFNNTYEFVGNWVCYNG